MAALVPELEELVQADRAASKRKSTHRADRRLRIGLYSFDDKMKDPSGKDS
jgi:hypothetical protein